MAETYLHPHPDMGRMLQSDTSALGTFMRETELRRALRHTKFPTIRGPEGNYDFPSFQARYKNSPAFIKWNVNSVPPHHGYSLAPHRDNHPILDPSSGFVSSGADVDLQTNVKSIPSLAPESDKVQLGTPSTKPPNSNRPQTPPHGPWTEEVDEDDVEGKWNSRKISDIALRTTHAGLPTERVIPKKSIDANENLEVGTFKFVPGNWRDDVAKKFMYSSVTQNNYGAVDWDKKLARKLKPCQTTLEKRADPITQQLVSWPMRYEPKADIYQRLGPSWDRYQTRDKGHGKRPYDFKSHYRRSDQIPGYEGSIGAYNFEDRDNPHETYRPFTTLRVEKPRPSDSSGRINIPGYTGCVHWTHTHSANRLNPIHSRSVSASVFREVSQLPPTSRWNRQGPMSKMVTTVPPQNPFNKTESDIVTDK